MKPLLTALRLYPESTLRLKAKWILILFLIPPVLYIILRSFETELTHFIIPYFPEEPDKSVAFYRDFVRLCLNEMLWWSLFLLLSLILFVYVPVADIFVRINDRIKGRSAGYAMVIIWLSLVGFLAIAYFTLKAFPNSGDEYVYVYQAETLSQGKLWNEAHPLDDFFLYSHIAQKDGISVGRFPPGWPLVLSVPFVLGFPAFIVNPVLAALSLFLFFHFTRKYYGPEIAIWALISLAFTSFFIFNSASFFSHTACLLFVLGFIYCLYLHLDNRSVAYALLAGAFLGFTVITRYLNAVLIFLPVLVFLFYRYKWKSIYTLFLIGLGAIPFVVFLFWYNYKITGDGFLPVTVWADPREALGFGVRGHTPALGIEHFIRRVILFLYWCSPALLLLYFIFLFKKIRSRAERFLHPEDYFVLMMILGYFLYYHIGGNQYGPRFWFEGLPFLVLLVVKKVFDSRSKLTMALLLAGLIYGIVKIPYITQREHQVVYERTDLYKLVEKEKISNAVVLISSHTGVIRPMGILDLPRNGTDYKGNVIYAIDLGAENKKIMEFYPDRVFYKYTKDLESVGGQLVRVK